MMKTIANSLAVSSGRPLAMLSTAVLGLALSGEAFAAGAGGVTGQGSSVSFSDVSSPGGMRMIIGAEENNDWAGAAVFFKRNDKGAWVQVKKVTEDLPVSTQFGKSVSMSGKGTLAVVGAPHASSNAGAAYLYKFSDNTWQRVTILTGKNVKGTAQQGESVFISYDGSTVFVGGKDDNDGIGAVWVYTLSGSEWKQQTKLVPKDAVVSGYDRPSFGYSISSSDTGDWVVIGGPGDNGGIGAAWVFQRKNGTWSQFGNKIVASGGTDYQGQGRSVAMNNTGKVFVVGAPYDNSGKGSATLFVRESTTAPFSEKKRFQPNSVSQDYEVPNFGYSVAISARAGMIVVGEPGTLVSTGNRGQVFSYSGQPDKDYTANPVVKANPCQVLGESVAVSQSADFLLAGAPGTPPGEPSRGGACFYSKDGNKWTIQGGVIAYKP